MEQNPHIIIGIGCSAGGLEAIKKFLNKMPSQSGISFVIIDHKPADAASLLKLLAKYTDITVTKIENGTVIKPDMIYVVSDNSYISIDKNTFKVEENTFSAEAALPVDFFFRSLAKEKGRHAIGIILSGNGTDGTRGLRDIKGEGGMIMVQTPVSSQFSGMPGSAIASGLVDYELNPEEMPEQLLRYIKTIESEDAEEGKNLLGKSLGEILLLLRQQTGNDFSSYKTNTLVRRIERRMNVHLIEKPSNYLRYLKENTHEIELLFKELLIGVTSFFRDVDGFNLMAESLPQILDTMGEETIFRAWVAGCSTGEEAYSLAIMVREYIERTGKNFKVQIFATDLDEKSINYARIGTYPEGIALDVSPQRLKTYFTKEEGHYRVKKIIREMVIFATQNLIQDPPFTKLNFISCRNLLIYLNGNVQRKVIPMFHYSLLNGGILFLGSSETIGTFNELFTPLHARWKIFSRKDSPLSTNRLTKFTEFSKMDENTFRDIATSATTAKNKTANIVDLSQKLFLKEFIPPSTIVNEKGDIYYIHGKTGLFLEPAQGSTQINQNVLDMAREGLQLPLTALIRKASSQDEPVFHKGVKVKIGGNYSLVDLRAKKIVEPEALHGMILVTFEDASKTKQLEKLAKTSDAESLETERLEKELHFIKQSLQNSIEELEAANEELKSTNEELQSTNEELQSANEELETAKEEMQSLNEELQTVNTELETKITDLSYAHDDMKNLLNSTGIATIFLDNNLHIKRFTNQAKKIVHLIPTDIGRPIRDIVTQLEYNNLVADANEVLSTLVYKEIEVRANDWSWYLMRILPYRTGENVIDGLVIIFVDITRLKKSEIILAAHNTALNSAIKASSVSDAAEELLKTIEGQSSGIWCSISIYDEKNKVLRHGAAPNLPDAFNKVLDGIKVTADAEEPCAQATYHKKHVLIKDIINDINNTDFHKLALKYDLKACWAQPVYAGNGGVLGTFTIYYQKSHQPSPIEEELVNNTVPLINMALSRQMKVA